MSFDARRRGAIQALKRISEWAFGCMEGEGAEGFAAYENCHVSCENLIQQYEAKKGPVYLGFVEWQRGDVRPPYDPPPGRRATKDEVMFGAATSDYIEFLIVMEGQVRVAAWSPSYGWPFDTPEFWAELPDPPRVISTENVDR